jgi:hypothetical protein
MGTCLQNDWAHPLILGFTLCLLVSHWYSRWGLSAHHQCVVHLDLLLHPLAPTLLLLCQVTTHQFFYRSDSGHPFQIATMSLMLYYVSWVSHACSMFHGSSSLYWLLVSVEVDVVKVSKGCSGIPDSLTL